MFVKTMKIKNLEIKKFRHMNNLTVEFGDRLTVISGQNGTGKSTILGMVGQIFDYKGKEQTKNNLSFATKYSEIFRFCKDNDKSGEHEYIAKIDVDNILINKQVRSRFIEKEGKYGRFRLDVGDRSKPGDRAVNFPVIYLGLKRLFPLAQEIEDSIEIKKQSLDTAEKILYEKFAKRILILMDKSVKPEDIKSPNKEFLAMQTAKYSHLGNSAGQDNLGQILTSILSFRELKSKKEDYSGGIFLIDEIDTTLYAGSQIKLIESLYKFSHDYDLQIIFTTHSLEILDYLKKKKKWNSKINFFESLDGKIHNRIDPSLIDIRSKILVQTKQKEAIPPVEVLCEDKITEFWCKNLLKGSEIKKYLHIQEGPFGAGTLQSLATRKHSAFKKMLFVLDADCNGKTPFEKCPRTLILPGKYSPEKELYLFLKNLDESDDFWDNDFNFTYQVCFDGFQHSLSPNEYKNWTKQHKEFFGRGYSKLFVRWKKDNKEKINIFEEKFKKELKKILEKGYLL